MHYEREVSRTMHEEHEAVKIALGKLEAVLLHPYRASVPDQPDPLIARTLSEIKGLLRDEVSAHFRFEEVELFPRLEESGESGLVELLTEEHRAITPLVDRVIALSDDAPDGAFDASAWSEFRTVGQDLVYRLLDHIEKEERGLVPQLDDLIDADTDRDLIERYTLDRFAPTSAAAC